MNPECKYPYSLVFVVYYEIMTCSFEPIPGREHGMSGIANFCTADANHAPINGSYSLISSQISSIYLIPLLHSEFCYISIFQVASASLLVGL